MKKSVISLWLLSCLACFVLSSCKSETPAVEQQETKLEIGMTTLDFETGAGSKYIPFRSGQTKIDVVVADNWCKAIVEGVRLKVDVEENTGRKVRTTQITLRAGTNSQTIQIRQLGADGDILISPALLQLSAAGGTLPYEITTNVPYTIKYPAWVKETVQSRANPMITYSKAVAVEGITTQEGRKDTIFVTETGNDTPTAIRRYILIEQSGLSGYHNTIKDEIKADEKITIVGGEASSFQQGAGIEQSWDGNTSTLYHSSWNNSATNYFPITLTYRFDKVEGLHYMVYTPRKDNHNNGNFKQTDILYSEDGNTFTLWKTHDFKGSGTPTRLDFPEGFKAKAVRFIVKSGAGDNQGFASCAEMEFFKKNDASFDFNTLFTDVTCSELKPGITLQDINRCTYPFFRTIAYYLYNKSYQGEFRIATFEAYPWPGIQSATHKTSPYSPLDNPTGISVAKGEELVVLVGDTHGKSLRLRVQNLDKPGGDGFGGEEYIIYKGYNRLTMREKGLVYVMYHTDVLDDPTALPIKIHFATGTVNGYFDSRKHTAEDWERLIGHATDKYFDVLGKYSHCIFETQNYRQYTTNGKALADVVDRYSYEEQRLMGLKKYNKMFRNRMLLTVMYHSYMYATAFHTGYNISTMNTLASDVALQSGGVWGPAHEIGHMNQTRPGLRWLGMTEVTNNIMSEYMQTSIMNQPSRLQTENMGGGVNRYTKAWNNIIVRKLAHGAEGDVFCKLVPFWQLELYFGNVLGMTPRFQSDHGGFYPDVYEHVRNTPNLGAGASQVEFCVTASKCAGYDLTDFFTKWGFLTPIDMQIDDYGVGQLVVSQAQIDAVKQRIAQMGLPRLNVPIEYINDVNWTYFKEKASVVKGTVSRNGNDVTLRNWKNVVAYELKNAADEVIYVGDGILGASTTAVLHLPGWQNGYQLWAVQADGSRIEITL